MSTSNRTTADWSSGTHSALVSIGTHCLSASITGPDRAPGSPVIILIPGVTSTVSEWPVAIRLIAEHARIFTYDRAGFGRSESSPNPPSPANIVSELKQLLNVLGVGPPYVLLGHSWGGILSAEFMVRNLDEVAGVVFADACAPDPTGGGDHAPWKDPTVMAVNEGIDYVDVTGITTSTVLSTDEWTAYRAEEESPKHASQAALEMAEVDASYAPMVARNVFNRDPPLLGNRPVCVVKAHPERDFQALYAAGIERGNGTAEQRAVYLGMLEGWGEKERARQGQFLTLSGRSRFMETRWCGHNLQQMEPEVLAEGVRWVLENLADER